MAAATGFASPLSFFVVAAIRPCNDEPAPENVPAVFVGFAPPVLCLFWYAMVGFGPKYASIFPESSASLIALPSGST